MTNNDLNQISVLMDKKLKIFGDNIDDKLAKISLKISSTEERLKTEMHASDKSLKAELLASDAGLKAEMIASNKSLKAELLTSDKRVTDNVSNFIEETLLPMINERFDETVDKADIDRIERKLDRLIDTSLDHEQRIKEIESVPVVAHELKRRKPNL